MLLSSVRCSHIHKLTFTRHAVPSAKFRNKLPLLIGSPEPPKYTRASEDSFIVCYWRDWNAPGHRMKIHSAQHKGNYIKWSTITVKLQFHRVTYSACCMWRIRYLAVINGNMDCVIKSMCMLLKTYSNKYQWHLPRERLGLTPGAFLVKDTALKGFPSAAWGWCWLPVDLPKNT